jgi:hypothetical protein
VETHLVPYVMGDVEVCYQAKDKIQEKLDAGRHLQDSAG